MLLGPEAPGPRGRDGELRIERQDDQALDCAPYGTHTLSL